MTNKSDTEKYFEDYRNKIKHLGHMREEVQEARKKIDVMRTNITKFEYEISSMRRIITSMVDNGWDPVEAKLKGDHDEFTPSLWDTPVNDAEKTVTITTSGTTCVTAAGIIPVSSSSINGGYTTYNQGTLLTYNKKKTV